MGEDRVVKPGSKDLEGRPRGEGGEGRADRGDRGDRGGVRVGVGKAGRARGDLRLCREDDRDRARVRACRPETGGEDKRGRGGGSGVRRGRDATHSDQDVGKGDGRWVGEPGTGQGDRRSTCQGAGRRRDGGDGKVKGEGNAGASVCRALAVDRDRDRGGPHGSAKDAAGDLGGGVGHELAGDGRADVRPE